jgi:hypothetical protein
LMFKEVFPWYFIMHILYFIQINPLYYLLFLYCTAPLLFNSFQCISLYHLRIQMQCSLILFTLYHSVFLFCLLLVPSDRSTIIICYLSISLHVYFCLHLCISLYMYLCTHLSLTSSFHI